jgi:diguanylate cyclase (GGDEF)-like protein
VHLPTLIAALLTAFALPAIGLAFAHPELRKRPELRLWATGSWFLPLGFLALASRAFLPDWFGIVLGNGLVLLGLWYYSRALHRFVIDEDAPRWQGRLALASGIGLVVIASLPVHLHASLISALLAVQVLPAALIARRGWHAETSLRTAAVMLGLAVVVLMLRGVLAWAQREDYADFFQGSLSNGLTFLLSYLLLLGAGFALVLAILERLTGHMRQLATHDGLTGCVNRVYFDAILNHTLERGRRDKTPVSLLLMDLDHLHQVNDRHGHRAGDDALRAFAQCVRERSRKSDVFGRLGGEEFGLILPTTDMTGAILLAQKVRVAVEVMSERAPGGERVSVTVSVGASTALPRDDLSGNQAYADADDALSEAKRQGGNRVVHHDAAS